jgi:putative membrane protein
MSAASVIGQWGGHMWGWSAGWMWFGMIAFWALVVAVVVFAIRGGTHRERSRAAEDVLAERYARGEIEIDEYQNRLRVLKEARGGRMERSSGRTA